MLAWLIQYSVTITIAIRTFLYGIVVWLFSIPESQAIPIVDGILIGGVLADSATWFFRALLLLPSQVWHGLFGTGINLIFVALLYRLVPTETPFNPETYSIACVSFLLVAFLKITVYSLDLIEKVFLPEDEN